MRPTRNLYENKGENLKKEDACADGYVHHEKFMSALDNQWSFKECCNVHDFMKKQKFPNSDISSI